MVQSHPRRISTEPILYILIIILYINHSASIVAIFPDRLNVVNVAVVNVAVVVIIVYCIYYRCPKSRLIFLKVTSKIFRSHVTDCAPRR